MADSRAFVSIGKAKASLGTDPFGPLPRPTARVELWKTSFGPEIEVIGKDWDRDDVVEVSLTERSAPIL